jgi:hypothetical protein
MFYRYQRFIYNYTKSTVRNTVDYSGRDTRMTLGQNQCKNTSFHYGLSGGKAKIVRALVRTVRPQARTVRSVRNRKTRR